MYLDRLRKVLVFLIKKFLFKIKEAIKQLRTLERVNFANDILIRQTFSAYESFLIHRLGNRCMNRSLKHTDKTKS